jgi:digeranylgeranylglycerophospholipid reductase
MFDRYEVVIAGAGPAGTQCARDVARRGYDVLILETENEAEFPRQSNKSTAGTFASMMGAFGVPDDVVMNYTEKVVLESPNDHFTRIQPGAVMDFAAFKQFLVEDGREAGAEYCFDARATAPITEDGHVVGVRYNGEQEVYADIVIDATGPAASLAKDLNVSDLERKNQAIGVEWEMDGVRVEHDGYADLTDAMMLRLDHDLAPGGYSWIFHTGADTAKVGLCFIQNERYRNHQTVDRTIDGYLDHWLDTDPRLANATRHEGGQHRGSAHIQTPNRLHTPGFMAIGDTVPTVDPLWGEGIDTCMKSGRAAAITADRCLMSDRRDTADSNMAVYDTLWHHDVAPKAERRLLMTRLLYLASNERYDRLLGDMNDRGIETLADANEGSLLAIARLIHFDDAPLFGQFLRDQVAERLA